MKGKKICISFMIVLLLSVGTGCSFRNQVQMTDQEEATQISFSWWGNDIRHKYTMDALNLFQQKYKTIDVASRYGVWNGYEKRNRVYMRSGDKTDVMQINYAWLKTYSADGLGYYDLNQLSDVIDLSNFTEEDLQFGTVNGKLNALPIAFNTSSLYYAKEIYEKYNLKIPETWDDLFAAAKVMKKDGVYPIGCAKKQLFLILTAYFEQTTGFAFFDENENLQITSNDIQRVLEFYKSMFDEKVLMPIDQWNMTSMADGVSAGAVMWVSDADNYCKVYEGAGYTPVLGSFLGLNDASAKRSGWYMKPATMYAISDTTEHPKEAAKLLDFLLNSPDMAKLQQTEKGVPISKAAYESLKKEDLLKGHGYEANEQMMQERENMNRLLPIMENEDIIDSFKTNSDSYIYGRVSVQEAAQHIYNEINKICNNKE